LAYRSVVKQWVCKQRPLLVNARNIRSRNNRRTMFFMWSAQRPLLCNGAVNTSLQKEGLCFLHGPYRGVSLKTLVFVGYSPDSNGESTEEEESPSVEAVIRKWLVENLMDWEH
jgi:hypothetical protein